MTDPKPESEKTAHSRLSFAARLLGGALRGTKQVPPAEEPWRNQRPKGRKQRKRKKWPV
jgi:hypothetical protein